MSGRDARSRAAGALVMVLALALVTGCAALLPPVAPAPTGAAAPPASAPGGSAAPSQGSAPAAAVVDSQPSREALAVLETIPEPLPAAERVPPPAPGATSPASAAPADSQAVAADSGAAARADTTRDSTRAEIPVPTETQPLGDRPGEIERLLSPDSAATAGAAAGAGAPPAAAPPAAPDTCFRIQIAARSSKAQAAVLAGAAGSQLLVPMLVEHEHGLYKVRSRDCLSREAADALRSRAVASGFKGTFRFVGTAK